MSWIKAPQFLAAALPLTLTLVGCAGDGTSEEITHEKEEVTEQAIEDSGWTPLTLHKSSAHPLPNKSNLEVEVSAPETARKFRIRFRRIDLESSYDFLIIRDQWGNEVERITGAHRSYVSRTINGNKAMLVLETDDSVESWGYQIDQLRHRGCAGNPPGSLALEPSTGCSDLKEAIGALATKEVRRRFTEGHFGGPVFIRRNSAAPEAAPTPAHSETNVQVAGVDEPDIVKTDGNFTYAIAGRQLRVFRTWPAAETSLVQSIDIQGWPRELFLENGKVVVLSGVQGDEPAPNPCRGMVCPMLMRPMWWRPDAYTKVTVLEISPGSTRVVSETLLSGQYQTARKTGSSVRLVLDRQLRWPTNIQYSPDGIEPNSAEYEAKLDELEADAIRLVRGRELADWLPKSYRIVDGHREPLPVDCAEFLLPSGSDEMGLTAIVTLDLALMTPSVRDLSMIARSAIVYQSPETLFLTTAHQWSCADDTGLAGQYTYVHALDVSRADRATYLASGGIVGNIENQFALDEHEGFLRVASTNTRWSAPTPEERTENRVYVLERQGTKLEVVGQTKVMAPGERIMSQRFMGDRGYVVTFRQVDPLFVLDLSNPRSPAITGELKIPGFSTYLHPLDATHLFAIGNDFEEDGRTRNGVALTIFDVSNPAAPRLTHKALVGTTNGYSEALYDHKAFTMYQAPGETDFFVAIPFTDWIPNENPTEYWNGFKSSLKVFRVSANGILGQGELDHSDLFKGNGSNEWGWWYQPAIRRGIFVEDHAYAISDAGIRVARVGSLSTYVASVAAAPQYENPTAPVEIATKELAVTPDLAIPDARPAGVTSDLVFEEDLDIVSLSVELQIKHPYRGDLVVSIEHDGVRETLHDRTGGSSDDLTRTFSTERFKGQNLRGRFQLTVADVARADVGTLISWKVIATGKARSPSTPTRVSRSWKMSEAVAIPDASSSGIKSELIVPEGVRIETLSLGLSIRHSYRGDLKVTLEHAGKSATIHDHAGGSSDDLRGTFPLEVFAGTDARGSWILTVIDDARDDVGTVESWTLDVVGTSL